MKKHTTINIEESTITLAKFHGINVSRVCQDAINLELSIKSESLDATVESMKDLALMKLMEEETRKAHIIINRNTERQKAMDMIKHIESAVAAGVHRGRAEDDYGGLFPDDLWNKYGVKRDESRNR